MTLDEFTNKIMQIAEREKRLYPELRLGQAVFNVVDKYVGVARKVQFEHHIDCFYNNDKIKEFIGKCWEVETLLQHMNVNEIDAKPHCLADTIPYMMSNDWKMRLLGEFYQLKLRYTYLKVTKFARQDIVQEQLDCMKEYAKILEERIRREGIELI